MIVSQKRKGISTFIATLLLMVLAVAAGVVIYAYTMGYLGSFGGPTTMGSISLDTSSLNTAPGNAFALNAYIRNIGHTSFTVDSVYVNGVKVTLRSPDDGTTFPAATMGYHFTYPTGTTAVPENGVGTLYIDSNPKVDGQTTQDAIINSNGVHGFIPSVTYDVKIVGKDNTQLSFQIKGS
jgi:hypothetical protein